MHVRTTNPGAPFAGSVRRAEAEPPSGEPPQEQEPDQDEERDSLWETVSRAAGTGLHVLGKIPRAYKYVPGLLRFALVDGLVTTLQVTAGLTGLAGMTGLSVAGVFEIVQGCREKDSVKVLSGSGEVARGLFIGGLSSTQFASLGAYQGTVLAGARVAGVAHGVLNLSSGMMKLRRGIQEQNRDDKIEGMLEIGMAASSFILMSGWPSVPLTPVLVAHGILAGGKSIYTNRATLLRMGIKARDRSLELGRKFVDIFRDEDEERVPARRLRP